MGGLATGEGGSTREGGASWFALTGWTDVLARRNEFVTGRAVFAPPLDISEANPVAILVVLEDEGVRLPVGGDGATEPSGDPLEIGSGEVLAEKRGGTL